MNIGMHVWLQRRQSRRDDDEDEEDEDVDDVPAEKVWPMLGTWVKFINGV